MGKLTKRERKFKAKGGVQARLEKGTITKKGKLRKKRRADSSSTSKGDENSRAAPGETNESSTTRNKKKVTNFLSPELLGSLDIDSFFAAVGEGDDSYIDDDEGEEAEDEDNDNQRGDDKDNDIVLEKVLEPGRRQLGKDARVADEDEMDNDEADQYEDGGEDEMEDKDPRGTRGNTRPDDDDEDNNNNENEDEEEALEDNDDVQVQKKSLRITADDEDIDDDKNIEGEDDDEEWGVEDEQDMDHDEEDEDDNHEPDDDEYEEEEAEEAEDDEEGHHGADHVNEGVDNKRDRGEEEKEEDEEGDDDSSDDDLEAAEAKMKVAMKKMGRSDPEFHDFLQQNEQSLLEFGDDDDDDDKDKNKDEKMGERVGDDGDEPEDNDAKPRHVRETVVTSGLLKSLERGTFQSHGIKSLKRLVGAYKAGCHMADITGDKEGRVRPGESGSNFVIESSDVFEQLMLMCLNRCEEAFSYHLLSKRNVGETTDEDPESKPLNPKVLENAEKWPEIRPTLVSFLRSTMHLLSTSKDAGLLTFILKALSKYIRYSTPLPVIATALLKILTELWSAPFDSSEEYQVVRLNAFIRIRQLALTQPFPFIEACLKKTYLAYARRSKTTLTPTTLPTLTFMGNSLVELYSLDYHSSYQHAFVYVRQLALLLRASMVKKTPEALQQVYCWQYVHCLKLWVAVLASAAPANDGMLMRSLIFPLTEIILGTVRLVPSPTRHLPLRFHCVRFLQQLAAASEVFIPTTSLLLDCLDWKEWTLLPKKTRGGSSSDAIQLSMLLRLPKDDTFRTHEQLEAGVNELFLLLQREIELYRYSAGIPEYSIHIVQRLRRFSKEVRNPRWRTFAKGLIDQCERYSAAAVQARAKLDECPKDIQRLECLRPISEKAMKDRHQESIEKEMRANQLSQPDLTSRETTKSPSEPDSTGKAKRKKRKKAAVEKEMRKPVGEKRSSTDDLMLEDDKVEEGVDWLDEEE